MVTCDEQEKVLSSQKVLLWIFLQIRNFIWRYAELNRLLVASGLIPLNIELQQDNHTVCCGHNTVKDEKKKKSWQLAINKKKFCLVKRYYFEFFYKK